MAPTLFADGVKPGDLIQIFRGAYEHWAVYIGGNEVVHLIPPCADSDPFSNLLTLMDSSTAQVRREKIFKVVGSHSFRVNNLLDDKYEPRERRVIVREACALVGWEMPYSLTSNNCEHFVTQLRYGKPKSRQVKDAAAMIGGAAIAGVGIVALGAALFSLLKDDDKGNTSD